MRRRLLSAVLGASSALALMITAAGPAAAVTPTADASVHMTIVGHYCTSWYSWRGANPSTLFASASWPRGSVKHCATKYKLADSDRSADYYVAELQSDFTFTGGARNLSAPAYQRLTSTRSAVTNSFNGTKSYTSSKSCSSPIEIGISVGIASVSVSPQTCSGYKVTRSYLGASSVGWTAPRAGGANLMDGLYFQKVREGSRPIFTFEFIRPTYTHTWTTNYYKETAGWSTRTVTL